jgi:hypothetical protein
MLKLRKEGKIKIHPRCDTRPRVHQQSTVSPTETNMWRKNKARNTERYLEIRVYKVYIMSMHHFKRDSTVQYLIPD